MDQKAALIQKHVRAFVLKKKLESMSRLPLSSIHRRWRESSNGSKGERKGSRHQTSEILQEACLSFFFFWKILMSRIYWLIMKLIKINASKSCGSCCSCCSYCFRRRRKSDSSISPSGPVSYRDSRQTSLRRNLQTHPVVAWLIHALR